MFDQLALIAPPQPDLPVVDPELVTSLSHALREGNERDALEIMSSVALITQRALLLNVGLGVRGYPNRTTFTRNAQHTIAAACQVRKDGWMLRENEFQQEARYGSTVRNFFGYYQVRDTANFRWKFCVSGFDSTSVGEDGFCTLLMFDQTKTWVPIDKRCRIRVKNQYYDDGYWVH
jgi:hypothetical protein